MKDAPGSISPSKRHGLPNNVISCTFYSPSEQNPTNGNSSSFSHLPFLLLSFVFSLSNHITSILPPLGPTLVPAVLPSPRSSTMALLRSILSAGPCIYRGQARSLSSNTIPTTLSVARWRHDTPLTEHSKGRSYSTTTSPQPRGRSSTNPKKSNTIPSGIRHYSSPVTVTQEPEMYTASSAFFEALWEAGVSHCFVNLGSDHPSIIEAMAKSKKEGLEKFPRIITCPNEVSSRSNVFPLGRLHPC